jgi:hypothetical protein
MKVIGVEFRIVVHNHVVGPRQYEVFLHPTDMDMPDDLGEVLANVTVHTSEGDHGSGNFGVRAPIYGMHHNNEQIKRTLELFEAKYFAKSPHPGGM